MRVVGSLTTLPKRIDKIGPTIQSILNQSHKLDVLYLNIPHFTQKGEKYVIPHFISKLNHQNIIKINRCKDYGAITKIIPTLQQETDSNTIILTFDDDVEYGNNIVEKLVDAIKKYPDACVGMSGWIVGDFPFQLELVKNENREVDWLQGTHCVAYRRRFLNVEELLGYPFFKKHDDHIISWNITKNGSKKYVIDGFDIKEREDVRRIDSISGSANFGYEVFSISNKLKQEGFYTAKSNYYKTIGFIITLIATIFILINTLLLTCYKKIGWLWIGVINISLLIFIKIVFEIFVFKGRDISTLFQNNLPTHPNYDNYTN